MAADYASRDRPAPKLVVLVTVTEIHSLKAGPGVGKPI
jgi:hypothetical protein